MAQSRNLKTFSVEPAGKDFSLHIEDESGHMIELVATRDQVDVLVDHLEDQLSLDDSADEVSAGAKGRA